MVASTVETGNSTDLLLKSADGGATWTQIPSSVTAVAPLGDGSTMIGALKNRIQRSSDGGATWTSVGPTIPWDIANWGQGSLADPVRSTDAWLCDTDGQNAFDYQTVDGGVTWKKSDCPQAIEPGGNHVLLSIDDISPTEGYVLRSTNGGGSWERIGLPHGIPGTEVAFDATKPNVVVIGADNLTRVGNLSSGGFWTLWRSTDAGLHWKKIWGVPKARCPHSVVSGCAKYYLNTPWANPSPVFADHRFVLGPLGVIRYGSQASRGAAYLVSNDDGLHWHTFGGPSLPRSGAGSQRIYQLPQTGSAVPTDNGIIAQGLGRPPSLSMFWRLLPGAKAWQREQFVITNPAP